jgi:hypothetical protein
MTFELDGVRYRIGFQHDAPRDWASHYDCQILDAEGRKTGELAVVLDKDGLYCRHHRVRLAGVSPAIARKLTSPYRSRIVIALIEAPSSALVRRELARNVRCIIYRWEGEEDGKWLPLYPGVSKLNTDAGDRYDRESGRIAALRDALPKKMPAPEGVMGDHDIRWRTEEEHRRQFCSAAMGAYVNRARLANYRARSEGKSL